MTDEMLTKAINDAWDGMEHAQMLRDFAQTDAEEAIADSLYHAHWAAYYILIEMKRKRKKERMAHGDPMIAATGGQIANATKGEE